LHRIAAGLPAQAQFRAGHAAGGTRACTRVAGDGAGVLRGVIIRFIRATCDVDERGVEIRTVFACME
jgi:hypothetical protein